MPHPARTLAVLVTLVLSTVSSWAQPDPTVERKTKGGVTYSVYLPTTDADGSARGATAIILLHGAGGHHSTFMTHWTTYPMKPEWIAISINAKANAAWQAGEEERVLEVLDEVTAQHPVRRVFVGGFSRGGGFCYNVALSHPDRFAGVLSLAGNIWNPALVKPDHADKVAIAIVHGAADKIIPVKHGQDAHDRCKKAGYKTFLKIIPDWAHRLHGAGTQEALQWLDDNAAPLKSAKDYYDYAMESFEAGRFADAAWALAEVTQKKSRSERFFKKAVATLEKIEKKSQRASKKLLKDVVADKNDRWVAAWEEFDRRFAGTETHGKVAVAVGALRDSHEAAADKLHEEALVAHIDDDHELLIRKCLQVRDRCYLATGLAVDGAKELLEECRQDPDVAKKFKKLLRDTELWR
ncbi:MAG: dienelactone hydrolase family protein [Planctomycetota bacterium]